MSKQDPIAAIDGSPASPQNHHNFMRSSYQHLRSTPWLVILSSPLIYCCAVPFVLLDLAVAVYQAVC